MVLFVTCSTPLASMGLSTQSDFFWIDNFQTNQHSDFINQGLDQLLKSSNQEITNIKQIVVDHGPGSFTGVRVAVGFARALAYGLKINLNVCTSLNGLEKSKESLVSRIKGLNAFRQSVYVEAEDNNIRLLSIKEFQQQVIEAKPSQIELIGDIYLAYESFWSAEFKQKVVVITDNYQPLNQVQKFVELEGISYPQHHPHVLNLFKSWQAGQLATELKTWNLCLPYYVRLSSAEEVLAEKSNKFT